MEAGAEPLVVFSHLRWDFVHQRPQHLMSRLSRRRPVIFIEEPVFDPQRAGTWQITEAPENVVACRPFTDVPTAGFNDVQQQAMIPMVRELLADAPADYIVWLYTPMALPLLASLRPKAVVYDCMDALALFLNAPPELAGREKELLQRADLVFTGGPSLYRARQGSCENLHCFPSSVDAEHFAQAKNTANEIEVQASLPHPRLGYFGVIDERIDLELIDALAADHPEWQIVMVGPIVKIDPATVPQRPNIHYFGQQAYRDLPRFLAGWDVCLLPFAHNDATRFISPTKTLEYMAAEKPIVSTRVADVADLYDHIVYLADSPRWFSKACELALCSDDAERQRRTDAIREVLAKTSWDKTAAAMDFLLAETLDAGGAASAAPPPPTKNHAPHRTPPADAKVVIIGAGPTGLSAAYHAGSDSLLLEREDCVGGWCRSLEVGGFTFDFAGHIMFSNDPYVHELYEKLLGENVHWQDREAWIYSHGVHTRYPFQGSLYGLPADVIAECVMGAVEAQFGKLKTDAASSHSEGNGNGHANGNGRRNGKGAPPRADRIEDCCGDGLLESTAPLKTGGCAAKSANFEDFIYQVWGAGIAKHFAVPYNQKLWAVPLNEMETSWLGGRVPMPDLREMIQGALTPSPKPMGPNARFGYPLRGGFQALMDGFLPHVEDRLMTGSEVVAISPERHEVRLASGETIRYQRLISTMPLPVLIRQLGGEAPDEIRQAVKRLRHVSVRCVHLGVGRENLTEKHWIYYPEQTVFHRIFVQGNASPHCNPRGGFGLTCEITYSPHKPLPCEGDSLIARCIADCREVGLIGDEDPISASAQCDLPYAYVVYDHARAEVVRFARAWLEEQDILLAGRYGEWEYYNSDHAFLAGKKAVEAAVQSIAAQVS